MSEWSTGDIGQDNEQLIVDWEGLDLSCDDASVDNEQCREIVPWIDQVDFSEHTLIS